MGHPTKYNHTNIHSAYHSSIKHIKLLLTAFLSLLLLGDILLSSMGDRLAARVIISI